MAAPSAGMQKTLLGFDYGRRRIGVAVGQQVTGSASALTTVSARDGQPDWPAITRLIEEWKPDALVVGIPYHMDGSEQDMTRAAQRFCRQLEGRYHLPVHPADERLSSWVVETGLAASAKAGRAIDPLSAQVILQDWLQQKEP
ncbi:MAG TPA: Holliday junction resolvase RuvX [Gammaproteobacteria bacterium]|nr:Holliday junction resolvase RuvX [Gammaproteobacteria bacterium]